MSNDDMLILKGSEVESLLAGRDAEVMRFVRRAYLAHAAGQSSLPHSNFLRFRGSPGNRIIALPAYLGAEFAVAGVKWISRFPGISKRSRSGRRFTSTLSSGSISLKPIELRGSESIGN